MNDEWRASIVAIVSAAMRVEGERRGLAPM
jgi:hypothetical protein